MASCFVFSYCSLLTSFLLFCSNRLRDIISTKDDKDSQLKIQAVIVLGSFAFGKQTTGHNCSACDWTGHCLSHQCNTSANKKGIIPPC